MVKVDNKRHAQEIPTLNTDWWNFGGITRDVKLLITPDNFIQQYDKPLFFSETGAAPRTATTPMRKLAGVRRSRGVLRRAGGHVQAHAG